MVQKAKAAGASVELITNGILLDEAVLKALMDAGLDGLWVSIDGATPKAMRTCVLPIFLKGLWKTCGVCVF
jgi:MoaA/NifB/PqqE/SkfB family radical SAM enzyme